MGTLCRVGKKVWDRIGGDALWHVVTEVKRYFLGPWGVWHVLTYTTGLLGGLYVAAQVWVSNLPSYLVIPFFLAVFLIILVIFHLLWIFWDKWQNRHPSPHSPDDQHGTVSAPPSLPPGLFEIEILEGELYWRDAGKQLLVPFTPDPDNQTPPTATVVLVLYARITAIPAQLLENIELIIVGQLLTLPLGYWHSTEISGERSHYFYFDLPSSIPPGKHPIRLIATTSLRGTGCRRQSPPFDAYTARTYQQLQSYPYQIVNPQFQSPVPPVDRSQPPLSFTNQSGGIAAGSIGTININPSLSDIKPQIIIGEPTLLNEKTDEGYYQTHVPLKVISPFAVGSLKITIQVKTLINFSPSSEHGLIYSSGAEVNGQKFIDIHNAYGDLALIINTAEPITTTNPITLTHSVQ